MKTIQFDENVNAKHLYNACSREGLVIPLRFPDELVGQGKSDPEVLAALLPANNLIVTMDRGFVHEHLSHVPDMHGGILVVVQEDGVIGSMTTHKVQSVLAIFKNEFPEWHTIDWRNSIICLSQSFVGVCRVSSGTINGDGQLLDRQSADWKSKLAEMLSTNAIRSTIEKPPLLSQ